MKRRVLPQDPHRIVPPATRLPPATSATGLPPVGPFTARSHALLPPAHMQATPIQPPGTSAAIPGSRPPQLHPPTLPKASASPMCEIWSSNITPRCTLHGPRSPKGALRELPATLSPPHRLAAAPSGNHRHTRPRRQPPATAPAVAALIRCIESWYNRLDTSRECRLQKGPRCHPAS